MKANHLMWALLLLLLGAAAVPLPAQQTEVARKRFQENKAKAEKGDAEAQLMLAFSYMIGAGVEENEAESLKWFRKSADGGDAEAQFALGLHYAGGSSVPKDEVEAVKWLRKAADQGHPNAQLSLGNHYADGKGVTKDAVEAAKWYQKSAQQGHADAQYNLGRCYLVGEGLTRDVVQAYKWFNLASDQGIEGAKTCLSIAEPRMTAEQIGEAQQLARAFKLRTELQRRAPVSGNETAFSRPAITGTGFFITEDGFLVTNNHVVKDATEVRLVTSAGFIAVKVVKADAANDLALLKAEGSFVPLPVIASRTVRLGSTVATIGFPNVGLQGFAPKLAKGEIAALSGAQDDPRYFQISVPIQPGNSGGALVDEHGNVVGVVSAKLNVSAALSTSGALPENVNYAVKSSFLLSFLESVPEVSAILQSANRKERKFEEVVKSVQQATVLVLVY